MPAQEKNDYEERIKKLEIQLDAYKDIAKKRSKTCNELTDDIPRKAAALEAHNHVIAGRNIAITGIVGVILVVVITMFNKYAASVTGIIAVGVLAFLAIRRTKAAQYLEEKYNINAKPLINEGGFKI